MRTVLRISSILLFISLTASALGYFLLYKPASKSIKKDFGFDPANKTGASKVLGEKLESVSAKLKAFSVSKGYNRRIAFLVDMSIVSGRRRFFVYNMEKDSIELAGLVTHGYGSQKPGVEFSNVPGSYCSSPGKYKVGKDYQGRFGLAYKLYGLDKTNDKAFERFVVLHAHDCVPVEEVDPLNICESQGCPTVAPAFLQKLKAYIDVSDKPILLNIFQ
ncbi:MAG: murein L,D-transpeptidase catalytic domain family protein [Rhizobacter sp.]|nr:murein L,D-transpeptidase catalytic domain family protein [Ferruginibacter sp.]